MHFLWDIWRKAGRKRIYTSSLAVREPRVKVGHNMMTKKQKSTQDLFLSFCCRKGSPSRHHTSANLCDQFHPVFVEFSSYSEESCFCVWDHLLHAFCSWGVSGTVIWVVVHRSRYKIAAPWINLALPTLLVFTLFLTRSNNLLTFWPLGLPADPTGAGEVVPSWMFPLCGVQWDPGWCALHSGHGEQDLLCEGLPQVREARQLMRGDLQLGRKGSLSYCSLYSPGNERHRNVWWV